jgi:hypothetical protein
MLAAINNKLRHFPQFASAVGIHCVRDCDGARAFVAAYSRYRSANPGFDAHEPIEPLPEPPPPPWLPNAGKPLPSPQAPPAATSAPSH